MKRFILLILVACICMPLCSDASEFLIRNGIKWGMTVDEVKTKMQEQDYSTLKEAENK